MLGIQPGGRKRWTWGCYRFTIERKIAPVDDRPRMERIEESLRNQYTADTIDINTFEHRLGRALAREEG